MKSEIERRYSVSFNFKAMWINCEQTKSLCSDAFTTTLQTWLLL